MPIITLSEFLNCLSKVLVAKPVEINSINKHGIEEHAFRFVSDKYHDFLVDADKEYGLGRTYYFDVFPSGDIAIGTLFLSGIDAVGENSLESLYGKYKKREDKQYELRVSVDSDLWCVTYNEEIVGSYVSFIESMYLSKFEHSDDEDDCYNSYINTPEKAVTASIHDIQDSFYHNHKYYFEKSNPIELKEKKDNVCFEKFEDLAILMVIEELKLKNRTEPKPSFGARQAERASIQEYYNDLTMD